MRLGSDAVAVVQASSLGTSICLRCSPKKQGKKKKELILGEVIYFHSLIYLIIITIL